MKVYGREETEKIRCFKIKKMIGGNDVSAFSAFEEGESVEIELVSDRRAGALTPLLTLTADEDGQRRLEKFRWRCLSNGEDIYTLTLRLQHTGLYFYTVRYDSSDEDSLIENPLALNDFERYNFQLSVYKKSNYSSSWLRGGIIYQIMCDRFFRSPESHDMHILPENKKYAEINDDTYGGIPKYSPYPGAPVDCNDFFGGDLDGIREKLGYIASLGVSCIYLNPIFDAYSNHKYDTGDYMTVDSMFGGNDALKRLIENASGYGIKIILDGVFNHTGDDSIYFNKYSRYDSVGAFNSDKSLYYGWYNFIEYPHKYRCWWNIASLPETNKYNPSFRNFINGENGVIRNYLKMGISGWRIDVADEIPDDFLLELKQEAKNEKKDSIIIGEVWEDASNKISYGGRRKYFINRELDSVMNYPLRGAIIDYLLYRDSEKLYKVSASLYSHYPKSVSDLNMNILGTHDTERIISVLSGKNVTGYSAKQLSEEKLNESERAVAIKRLMLAYILMTFFPGIPGIYYGDEAGTEGWHDPFCRKCYPWGKEDKKLIEWYKKIGAIRRSEEILKDGLYRVLFHCDGVFVFAREKNSVNPDININYDRQSKIIIAANNSGKTVKLLLCGNYTELLSGERVNNEVVLQDCEAKVIKKNI